MVTKTKEPPAVEEPVDTEPAVESDDFVEKVTAIVKDILKGDPAIEDDTSVVETETEKPLGPRDEEARMFKVARAAVEEFKKSMKGDDETETKSEPEKVPMSKAVRWIEKVLWGKE